MDDSHTQNAMTEIALALAMGFFSIMVLTMVSMGAGKSPDTRAVAAVLAPARESARQAAVIQVEHDDIFVIYHRGRFFDGELRPLDPSSIHTTGRVVLALEPSLPMSEAVAARARIDVRNLIVSTLDERWQDTLARRKP